MSNDWIEAGQKWLEEHYASLFGDLNDKAIRMHLDKECKRLKDRMIYDPKPPTIDDPNS